MQFRSGLHFIADHNKRLCKTLILYFLNASSFLEHCEEACALAQPRQYKANTVSIVCGAA
jgi:hypothetical protein